ncbi:MAG: LysR family transcriptional regulator [Panacagrimonas sp.]
MTKHAARLDWNDIPLLLAVARERQLRAASRSLGVDVSTVSRRLAAAEERIQARLFIRDPEGYKPTDAGQAFIEAAEAIERTVLSIFQIARETADEISGPVRITSVDALLNDWLTARLPPLLEAYPGLEIRLIPDNRNVSFTRSEADLALRMARPEEDAAILMRRVGRIGVAVYGHPKFQDVPQARWSDQPWLTYNDDLADVPQMQWLRSAAPKAESHFRASSTPILLKACEAGMGMTLLPCISTKGSGLVRLSAGVVHEREIWLLSHRDATSVRRFRIVADWLAQQLAMDDAFLAGIDET